MLNCLSYLTYLLLSLVDERSICLTVVGKFVAALLLMAVLTVELVRLVAVVVQFVALEQLLVVVEPVVLLVPVQVVLVLVRVL